MKLKTTPPYDLVIGLGTSGSAMAEYLNAQGRAVVGTDLDGSKTDVAARLEAMGIETQVGLHDPDVFKNAARLILSPGIPPGIPLIRDAVAAGAVLTGELDIFYEHNTLPVIAVSGTNGKTTTTTLVGEMLSACGKKPFVGGNIGTPLVCQLSRPAGEEIIVAEVSSFQLDLAKKFRPDVGVLLNISEDHLDRYENYAAYEQSKWSLFERQKKTDTAIVNTEIRNCRRITGEMASNPLMFSSGKNGTGDAAAHITKQGIEIRMPESHFQIPGKINPGLAGVHNLENIAAAALACLSVGGNKEGILQAVTAFKNLSHRLAYVETVHGVKFYDDSKATNTDAVIRALACFDTPVALILGGRGKGTDFSQLVPAVQKRVKAIVAIGETAETIKHAFSGTCTVHAAENMQEAVQKGFSISEKNGNVVLSPACASFDMYENYSQRGDDFIHQVNCLKAQEQ